MNQLLHVFREYPIAIGIVVFCSVSLLLAVLLSILMLRAGLSLKPLVFFFGFLAIVAVPQGVVHLLDALAHAKSVREQPIEADTSQTQTPAPVATGSTLQPVSWEIVFGPNADPSLITDAKRGLEYIVGDATEAKLSFNTAGESALAARFPTAGAAAAALNRYGTFFQFAQVTGSDALGWTARRFNGQGEWNHVVATGNELYAWSGQTKEAVEANRVRALGPLPADMTAVHSAPANDPATGPSKRQVSTRLASNWRVMTVFLVVNLTLAVFWFFKASAWCARQSPVAGTRPEPVELLRARLLDVNQQNVPVQVTTSPDGQTIEITWRYADAQWFDLMAVHKMRRTHKLVLAFDDRSRKVRVREYWSAFDASAGIGGLRLNWNAASGMQFFNVEHKRVVGVQLDAAGKPTGELSTAYTFSLQALKQPIIDAVTAAGWTWQPVMWNAPDGLRWLTE
ncbi:MAG TPA: hypothetical protein PKA41_15240 [Verrucomicrobiota bacterium]|nr:hypothetical protein [Verrucomicrobiota bacterium]